MTRDEALKKIKKCLALGRSANEHEAAAALRQAQKLMEQFDLREQDISLADVSEVKVKACSTAANAWELSLVGMVADAFGCEQFGQLKGHYNSAGNFVRTRHWVFVGIDAAPTVAGYACEVLLRQCARARLTHIAKQPKNCKPITKTARGDAFALGWVAAVRDKVSAFARPAANEALLLAYIEREHGELKPGKVRNVTKRRKVDGHLAAGWREGRDAKLHHAVGGEPARGLLS
ncbi:DUF2786 domain-containing protein [Paracidovorax cattleyae]|uniref:DUF2786 domain-containing protein n=1 Tax=Paracidovorax cattleyae TaxID=80868 RepID=UPI0018AFD87C|nr:DUF2786 domain-containing protein [Paracidovorax cattleyae]MBF9265233.1 DUF2786 domain-containing protein [Paracidovorax cattleyae]